MSEEERMERESAQVVCYSVKFVCGLPDADELEVGMVRPGVYATESNINNYHDTRVEVRKLVLPLVAEGKPRGREPELVTAQYGIVLPTNTATMDDSFRIAELVVRAAAAAATAHDRLPRDRQHPPVGC